ncbi:hypothetical protein ACFQ3Y_24775 [Paenibacillus motobuensis]|uniref:hypothetical protein n=1 Tax=Paenibacillus motobuensis TaxID=295324 RepID=UPI0036439484
MINVPLTQDYRLTTDGTQFIVRERKIVDPTRAPGYKAPKDGSTPPLGEKWVDAGYYGYTATGLSAALDSVRIKAAARGDAETLEELLTAIQTETDRMVQAFNHGEIRDFDVKLAS